MLATSTFTRAAPVAASCVLHLAVGAALLAFGSAWPARAPVVIVEADLIPAETPAPPPLEPEKARPERKIARAEPPPKPLVLPRPIDPPRREMVTDPPADAPPPAPAPVPEPRAARVESAPAAAAAPAEPSAPADAPGRRREPTGPAVDALPGPGPARTAPPPAAAPAGPTATARAVPDGPSQLARPRGGYQVKPSYPASARRLGVEGTTLLRVYVAADGQVTDVQVDESAGHPDLDRAAADAVRRWRFEPARRGAEPVGMWVRLPVQFVLR